MNMLDITGFRYCPACGQASLEEGPDAKSCHCRQCDFRYYHNVASAVAAIIESDGNILLTRRAFEPGKGLWDLPGGFVDYGETPEQALHREIREELNLEIRNLRFLATHANPDYWFRQVRYMTADICYTCSVPSLDTLKIADDVSNILLLPPKEAAHQEFAFSSPAFFINHYLKYCYEPPE